MFKRYLGFTLAEVLITLAIIGIVATLTLPTLINNYQKTQYVAGLKKEYSAVQQAFKLYMADQGTTDLSQTDLFNKDGSNRFYNSTTRQTVWDSVIKKYFKLAKSCNVGDNSCYYVMNYLTSSDDYNSEDTYNYDYVAYLTDGASLDIDPKYQEWCQPDASIEGSMKGFCSWVNIDVNGPKSPNKFGRDIFQFVLSPDGNLYPYDGMQYAQYNGIQYAEDGTSWSESNYYWKNVTSDCGDPNSSDIVGEVYGDGCAARIMEEGWQMNY